MKWLVKLMLLVLAGVAVTLLAIEDTGYVLISRQPWVIELSMTLFILLIVISFIVLYGVLRFISNTWGIGQRMRDWQQQRRHNSARQNLNKGLLELAQRNWVKAEKLLTRHVEDSESPLLNFLAAASAAQEQNADKRRDEYLSLAHDSMPGSDVAVALTQVDLQLRHGQLEQALATLMHLRSIAPKHPYVLKLLVRLYGELQDWKSLYDLLPVLRKQKLLVDEEWLRLEQKVFGHMIQQANTLQAVQGCWSNVPKKLRQDDELVKAYAEKLIAFSAHDEAIELLRKQLTKIWNSELVEMYADADGEDSSKQLNWAEVWQAEHSDDPVLLESLGRLAVKNELWGKAQAWLEASIGVRPHPVTYRLLGELLEQLEKPEQAADCYRKGLLLTGAN